MESPTCRRTPRRRRARRWNRSPRCTPRILGPLSTTPAEDRCCHLPGCTWPGRRSFRGVATRRFFSSRSLSSRSRRTPRTLSGVPYNPNFVQSKFPRRRFFFLTRHAVSIPNLLFAHSRVSDHGVHGMVELLGQLRQRIENAYQVVFDAREGSHVQV